MPNQYRTPHPLSTTTRPLSPVDAPALPAKPLCFMRPPQIDEKCTEEMTGLLSSNDPEARNEEERVWGRVAVWALLLSVAVAALFGGPILLRKLESEHGNLTHAFLRNCYMWGCAAAFSISIAYSSCATVRIAMIYPAPWSVVGTAITAACAAISLLVAGLVVYLVIWFCSHVAVV